MTSLDLPFKGARALGGETLKESGKGGTGRFVVTDETADKARELIMAAHKAHVAVIEAKTKADRLKAAAGKAEPKPSGKRARSHTRRATVVA